MWHLIQFHKSISYYFVVLTRVLMFCFHGFVFLVSRKCLFSWMGPRVGKFRYIFLYSGDQAFRSSSASVLNMNLS